MSEIFQHQYDNGLWLLGEPIEGAQSVAMTLLLPGGIVREPANELGVGAVLDEMIWRGAGDLDSRAHSDALDFLGVQRGSSVESTAFRIGATMIGSKLADALPLLCDLFRRPALPDAAMEPCIDLASQAIESLDDEPQQKTFLELRANGYPPPFDRSQMGQLRVIRNLKREQVQSFANDIFVPNGAILSFAGNIDFDAIKDQVGELLGDWSGKAKDWEQQAIPPAQSKHVQADSVQVHIGLGYHTVNQVSDESVLQRAAVAALSGGMSGRLFTEVREKRGLCYAVYATYAASRHLGVVLGYAGTTTARAQETLDVMRNEMVRLSDGIDESEFQRAIVGMKSRLVMQGESTCARAAAIASDQYTFGRPRGLDELAAEVDSVTLKKLNDFVASRRPEDISVLTIGPEELQT